MHSLLRNRSLHDNNMNIINYSCREQFKYNYKYFSVCVPVELIIVQISHKTGVKRVQAPKKLLNYVQ